MAHYLRSSRAERRERRARMLEADAIRDPVMLEIAILDASEVRAARRARLRPATPGEISAVAEATLLRARS